MVNKKNKKGWIDIVEVFLAILLMFSVLTLLLNLQKAKEQNKSEEILKQQDNALKIIQFNDSMRSEVLYVKVSENINNTINKIIPNYNCEAKICNLSEECNLDLGKKEVYADSVLITTDNIKYDPKQLKLFCWEK